ncbi:monoamine oxidase [Allocatelliglobosispora scoriae]|uniref:Monoamine oxidase n=1 Tax=Allocatelliglobosispora scoriae TaxID=643052 RepID=A0A841C3J3_9ACTN|nr:NAD(P)/FAD-dependent oxidoreductase [Allocatelliglobosispora scoriae]MBB5873401.1 monoamine oxidase [Allocatelliglobosispora scoriae]
MAHSPMMHALQRLLRTPATGPAAMSLDRRTLLRGIGATAALAAVGAPPRPREDPRRGPVIAIVGGGLAGLTAALTLADAGRTGTIYEASGRVGGRVRTLRGHFADGQLSEWGGELIDTGHTTMHRLVRRFGLGKVDVLRAAPKGSDEVLHFLGGYYDPLRADADFQPVRRRLRRDLQDCLPEATWSAATPAARALDRMSVAEWIDTRVPGGHDSPLGRFLDVAYRTEYGAETGEISALGLVYVLGYQPEARKLAVWGESDERYRIRGGNDLLPQAIAAALPPESIRTGWTLLAVRTRTDGRQVLTFQVSGATREVVADHTVLALPLGVLQRIDVSGAGFDARKTAGIAAMRMGACTKLNMQFSSRIFQGRGAWPGVSNGQAFSDRGFQCLWQPSLGQAGASGILNNYLGGDAARRVSVPAAFLTESDRGVAALARATVADAAPAFPGLPGVFTGKAALSAWHLDPLTRGAYSFWPVGYVSRYAGYEKVRQGNVHFAGEHCSYEFQGFMNGAAASGIEAAREVLADLTAARPARHLAPANP